MATDFSIIAPPRISRSGFTKVLQTGKSPAAPEAAACYDAFVAKKVDPAVGLAIFQKESTFGRLGLANENRSWGNIRSDEGFRKYPSWTAGAADAARLLVKYGKNTIRPGTNTSTVQTFPFVWAPAKDGNAPDEYGNFLAASISNWAVKFPTAGQEEIEVYAFALERWFIDDNPSRLVTTVGAPTGPDGKPDFSRRLALVSGKGGVNLRLELLDRHRLTPTDWSNQAALTQALTTYSLPAVPPEG